GEFLRHRRAARRPHQGAALSDAAAVSDVVRTRARPDAQDRSDRQGAVGEVSAGAFDPEGHIIEGDTNRRLTSIPPQVPARALTIGAAVGPAKVSAIRAALKGRLINGLITDEATANAILQQWGN